VKIAGILSEGLLMGKIMAVSKAMILWKGCSGKAKKALEVDFRHTTPIVPFLPYLNCDGIPNKNWALR
jgi:hypothetical protein